MHKNQGAAEFISKLGITRKWVLVHFYTKVAQLQSFTLLKG